MKLILIIFLVVTTTDIVNAAALVRVTSREAAAVEARKLLKQLKKIGRPLPQTDDQPITNEAFLEARLQLKKLVGSHLPNPTQEASPLTITAPQHETPRENLLLGIAGGDHSNVEGVAHNASSYNKINSAENYKRIREFWEDLSKGRQNLYMTDKPPSASPPGTVVLPESAGKAANNGILVREESNEAPSQTLVEQGSNEPPQHETPRENLLPGIAGGNHLNVEDVPRNASLSDIIKSAEEDKPLRRQNVLPESAGEAANNGVPVRQESNKPPSQTLVEQGSKEPPQQGYLDYVWSALQTPEARQKAAKYSLAAAALGAGLFSVFRKR